MFAARQDHRRAAGGAERGSRDLWLEARATFRDYT